MANRVLVFGATGGIGSEICRRLVAKGDRVFLCGRNSEKLTSLSAELDSPFGEFDISSDDSIKKAYDEASSHLGPLNGIVYAVGSVLLKPAHLTSVEEFSEVMAVNLTSAFSVLHHGVRALRDSGGSIVFFSSAAASIGLANHEAIAAAKGGIEAMVRSAAASYAAKGVRINAIAPGLVETPLTVRITSSEASREYSQKLHPVGRLGTAADIASGALWLLSPEQSWVNGHVLHIDGGLSNLKG
jgi:NAD(P)-dependent dehydrogenase (short-subunit alcohol dehydrogenase family)